MSENRIGGEPANEHGRPDRNGGDGYETRDIHPASRGRRDPNGNPDDRRNGDGYTTREVMPRRT